MSIYERKREFIEDEDALADDIEVEFDGIAAALNSLVAGGVVSASEDLTLKNTTQDVPGAEVNLSPTVASKLLVVANFRVFCSGATIFEGFLRVGESDQSQVAYLGETTTAETMASQIYVVDLAAGTHTVKLRAKAPSVSGAPKVRATHSRLLYLLIPDPEP